MNPTSVAGCLLLFAMAGGAFIFAALLLGRFLRPKAPTPQKRATYECGEPAVGSSYVQFDLRFYVVALLFLIFDVEVAFLFPWAVVFGKAAQLANPRLAKVVAPAGPSEQVAVVLTSAAKQKLRELGVKRPAPVDPAAGADHNVRVLEAQARRLALTAIVDMGVFFGVLLVGFAYVWYRGDLTWVRAIGWPQRDIDLEFEDSVSADLASGSSLEANRPRVQTEAG